LIVVKLMSEEQKDKTIDVGRVAGWVEVIVRDKHGRIKYRLGAPPEKIVKVPKGLEEECKEGNCPFPSSFPAKLIDLEYWRKNVITNVGLACMIRLVFAGLTEDKFGYLGIGSGTTAEAVTDTDLEYPIKRKASTQTQTTTTITGDTCLCEATFSSADALAGTMTVSEVGIFNLLTGGDLLARKVFAGVPLDWDAGDTLTVRYYVQQTR